MKDNEMNKSFHPRHLARRIAHENMKKKGIDNPDKPFFYYGKQFKSYFATHWRDYVNG